MRFFTIVTATAMLSLAACNPGSSRDDNDDEDRSSRSDEDNDRDRDRDRDRDNADSDDRSSDDSSDRDRGGDDDSASLILGTWTDNGQCTDTIEMNDDGSFVMFNGARGEWELDGDELTLSGGNGSASMTIDFPDDDTMTLTHPNGQVGRSTRCD